MAGAGARFLENQRDALAGERTARIGTRRQIEDRVQPPGVEIGDGEDVAGHQSASFLIMVPMPSSVRSSISKIGRAHVCTPVTNAHLVCRLLLENKQTTNTLSPTI